VRGVPDSIIFRIRIDPSPSRQVVGGQSVVPVRGRPIVSEDRMRLGGKDFSAYHDYVGMEAHPAVSNATRRDRCVWLHAIVFVCSGFDAIPETMPPLDRFGSGRDPRSDGGGT